jgi:1-acyl-sn-glycerol-3-phosphate acyltransferase
MGLLFFDAAQRISLNVFGYQLHKVSVDYFNVYIVRILHVLGTRYTVELPRELPVGKPVIIVSNHQSMWDIPPLIWFLRKLHVKFISKKELGKGIPSISYNLRKGGSVLIDRNDSLQSTKAIINGAKYISETNRSLVIFPEGTRSRDGSGKPFKRKGLQLLFENAPDAYVLPVSVSNSWKLQKFGMFPMPLGVHLKIKVHAAIKVSNVEKEKGIDTIEKQITEAVTHS